MGYSIMKNIIAVAVLFVLLMIAVRLLHFAISVLLPIAIIIIAAYIVYTVFSGR